MGVYFLFWSHSITVVPIFGVLTKYILGAFQSAVVYTCNPSIQETEAKKWSEGGKQFPCLLNQIGLAVCSDMLHIYLFKDSYH